MGIRGSEGRRRKPGVGMIKNKGGKMKYAWHFVGDTLRDGRPIPKNGVWLKHNGPLELCMTGLHASYDPFDALTYAPGSVLCRVAISGKIIESDDKLVASKRKIIKRRNVEKLLIKFACLCALDVANLWDMPPVVKEYLTTQNEELRDAASAAASAASGAAARAAAWAAAREAAGAAAWDAASAAANAAAREAAWAAQRKRFNQMVKRAFR